MIYKLFYYYRKNYRLIVLGIIISLLSDYFYLKPYVYIIVKKLI